jgi:hypothetical protein
VETQTQIFTTVKADLESRDSNVRDFATSSTLSMLGIVL